MSTRLTPLLRLKRLRNTAASARFRAKKKRREESLERNAREKREKLVALEDRIAELEAENQWLKNLIIEKNQYRSSEGAGAGAGADHRPRGMNEYDVQEDDRKGYERKDGVGT